MTRFASFGATARLTAVVLFLFVGGVAVFQSGRARSQEAVNTYVETTSLVDEASDIAPPARLIDNFDAIIQKRFLTMPNFGIARVVNPFPARMSSTHLSSFSPRDADEFAVGMYLFGRRVIRREKTRNEKYDIKYRLFDPIKVVSHDKKPDYHDSKKFAEQIKQAFVEFQRSGGEQESEIRFERGKWSFVARPVRAVNQSCLDCHTDYVISERLGEGKFTARKRRLGDPNGVIVYAFTKRGEAVREQ
jgi:hypothetical protein